MAELTDIPDPEIGEHLFGRFDEAGEVIQRGLLTSLRDAGLPIGPREQIAVGAVVAELISTSETPVSLADLGAHIAPLVARSPQERETFFRVFDALAPGWREVAAAPDTNATPEPFRPEIDKGRSPVWRWMGRLALVVAVVALAAWLVFRFRPEPMDQPIQTGGSQTETRIDPPSVEEPEPLTTDEMEGLARIQDIASAVPYYGAPTLQELGRELALTSEIGWSAEAYTQRLHELTGLPQRTPIAIGGSDMAQLSAARLGAALDIIERSRVAASVAENLAKISGFEVTSSRAEDFALAISDAFETDVAEDLLAGANKTEAISSIRASIGVGRETLPDELIERGLAVSSEPSHHRIWADAPWLQSQPPPNDSEAPWWAVVLATSLPLLAGLVWLANAMRRKKAYLRRRKPEFPPLHMDLLAEAATEIKANAGLFQRAAQRLAQRTPRATDRLDIERTVQATIREGGVSVSPVFQELRAEPEYLVLIEKRAGGDHDFERLRQMARKLEPVVKLDIYSYQTEPSILQADRGGKIETLDRVLARHGDHRLLVLGSGVGFLEPRSQKPVASAEKLMRIERRALLTPLPLAEWAQEEIALARELDMPIGRATPEGLVELAELLRLDGAEDDELLKPDGDGRARPLPDMLRLRGGEFLYETPPGDDEERTIEQLVLDLRNYLDRPGFEWLCALAVYPAIQWDLTLYLGVALAEREGGDAKTAKLYREDRLAAIAQLPWFREGEMPNWLRRALIARLPEAREMEVREAINRLLHAAGPGLKSKDREVIQFRITKEDLEGPDSPDELFEDEVLLDFLARGNLEDFETEDFNPEKKQERLPLFNWRHLAGPALAAAYAAAAFAVAPKPWEGALITGAWLPLVLLALGGLVGLALVNGRASYSVRRAGTERAAPYGLAFATLVAGLWVHAFQPGLTGGLPLPAIYGLLVLIVVLTARWVADWSGVFTPPTERPLLRWFGIAIVGLGVGLAALVADVLAPSIVGKVFLVTAGLAVFAFGVLAARYAPEKLPPPKEKIPLGAKPRVWPNALRGGALLAGALPALALAAAFVLMHARVPPVAGASEVVPERILATSPDGRFFATGDTLGEIAVFEAARPRELLRRIQLEREPVTSLAVRETEEGRLVVAAATLTGSVRLFDGRGGSQTLDTGIVDVGLRPQIALGPDGGWAVAGQDEAGKPFLITDQGNVAMPDDLIPLGLAGTSDPDLWVFALHTGVVGAARPDAAPSFAEPRLAGRPRWVRVDGTEVRALGEDGTMLVAELTPEGLVDASMLPDDERFFLGALAALPEPEPLSEEPQPDLSFTVYFEWDTSVLNSAALAEIDARLEELPLASIERVLVTGHMDTSNTREYAVGLSQRMADNVAGALVQRGVPQAVIEVRAFGESDLAVETEDGVREPLNRRVEVLLFASTEIEETPSLITPSATFRDCENCPEMVVVPAGAFTMGSPTSEAGRDDDEGPQRRVRIAEPFAVGRFEVTFDEWDACVAEGGCDGYRPDDRGWGRGDRPVINVSWRHATAYADWLSRKTGEDYRLLSEAEWEYVARAGTSTRFSWGEDDPACERGAPNGAVFSACDGSGTQAVGFSALNGFGIHDMHGNVWEWVEDCYVENYSGAPSDGSARIVSDCSRRVLRGGSWYLNPSGLRSALRVRVDPSNRSDDVGFRLARTVSP